MPENDEQAQRDEDLNRLKTDLKELEDNNADAVSIENVKQAIANLSGSVQGNTNDEKSGDLTSATDLSEDGKINDTVGAVDETKDKATEGGARAPGTEANEVKTVTDADAKNAEYDRLKQELIEGNTVPELKDIVEAENVDLGDPPVTLKADIADAIVKKRLGTAPQA